MTVTLYYQIKLELYARVYIRASLAYPDDRQLNAQVMYA